MNSLENSEKLKVHCVVCGYDMLRLSVVTCTENNSRQ